MRKPKVVLPTDEVMAKEFGWTEVRWRKTSHGGMTLRGLPPNTLGKTPSNVPEYTTSLDAIVREVARRGFCGGVTFGHNATLWTKKPPHAWLNKGVMPQGEGDNKDAAMAICLAVLDYKKRRTFSLSI